ncbi:histidine kinase [Plantactinospora solaniradicis]|uniref:Histidine kinase n=1 Tax=Plantactinospora solaniradicis TaxID=1723736 RepID=A0ABW1K381_9ACTN
MLVDPFKVAHWMNARKHTATQVAELAGVPGGTLTDLLGGGVAEVDDALLGRIALALRVDPAQLCAQGARDLTVVHQSAEGLAATCRPIQRDGIHFYNYYSMAAPPGRVAPVILDILCPADRLPALNNGHLEPAITVNLGPGDIHGRWGEELTPQTWQVLHANSGDDPWIVGDSYVEPSYCPHSYSLAGAAPARIVSYTGQSNMAPVIEEANTWSDSAYARYLELLDGGLPPGDLLDLLLARRGYQRSSAADAIGLDPAALDKAVSDPVAGIPVLRALARTVGLDYRLLLPAERSHDAVGKSYRDVPDARASRRRLGPYEVASMASAPHLPDLTGLYLRVHSDGSEVSGADLVEPAESHYFVATGVLTLDWDNAQGQRQSTTLTADGSAWVGPFVRHRWSGDGALLKFGSGSHVGYLDLVELTNTYAPAATARRGRRDLSSWGYDEG